MPITKRYKYSCGECKKKFSKGIIVCPDYFGPICKKCLIKYTNNLEISIFVAKEKLKGLKLHLRNLDANN
jgi:hypothetical protein